MKGELTVMKGKLTKMEGKMTARESLVEQRENEIAEREEKLATKQRDLAEWKQKARIRFVLQHSNEPSMLHVTCQALFELSGVEKDNVAAWPGSRDKPEVVPAICLKRTGLPSTSFAVR